MRSPRPQPTQRPHIHDAPSALSQIGQRLARYQKRSARVRSKNCIPLRHGNFLKLDGFVIRGVIHQHVDSAQFPRYFLHRLPDVLLIRDIAPHRQRFHTMQGQFFRQRPRLARRLAISDRYVGAVLGRGQSDRPPQSFCRARHQQRFSGKCPSVGHQEILRPSFCAGWLLPCASWKPCTETATLPRMTQPREVVVYSRKGCHLCEIVTESLVKLHERGGFTWREIDVDSDAELRRRYNDEVPVVFSNGHKALKYHMDEQEFLRKLSA